MELTKNGVEKFKSVNWPNISLRKREDGSGFIKGIIAKMILTFYQITLSHMGKMQLLRSL